MLNLLQSVSSKTCKRFKNDLESWCLSVFPKTNSPGELFILQSIKPTCVFVISTVSLACTPGQESNTRSLVPFKSVKDKQPVPYRFS